MRFDCQTSAFDLLLEVMRVGHGSDNIVAINLEQAGIRRSNKVAFKNRRHFNVNASRNGIQPPIPTRFGFHVEFSCLRGAGKVASDCGGVDPPRAILHRRRGRANNGERDVAISTLGVYALCQACS
jgi:hypothetical protein